MIELSGQKGELRLTLQITRKDTGKVEEVEMVGFLDPDDLEKLKAAELQQNPQE